MGKKRILVVDDNVEVARSLSKILSAEYEVDTYFDSREAMVAVLAGKYACVISDGEMPYMSGPMLMQQVILQRPDMKNRFVFHTGAYFAIVSALSAVGPAEVLNKPASKSRLLEAVDRVVT